MTTLMHNAFGVRNIRQQFIRRNCFYRVLTRYLVSHDNPCKLSATRSSWPETRDTSQHAQQIFRECPRRAGRVRLPFRAIFGRVYYFRINLCSYSRHPPPPPSTPPPSFLLSPLLAAQRSFMFYVDGIFEPRRCVRVGDRNKGKICKMIRVANSIASGLED